MAGVNVEINFAIDNLKWKLYELSSDIALVINPYQNINTNLRIAFYLLYPITTILLCIASVALFGNW